MVETPPLVDPWETIRQQDIIVLSPHYDDAPLTFGGLLLRLAAHPSFANRRVRVVTVFSRSNYQARDDAGNRDLSEQRIKYATAIRYNEDRKCLNAILGLDRYAYEIVGETECVLRSKGWKPGEKFEFPQGNWETFDEWDRTILKNLVGRCQEWLALENSALLLPVGVKEHVDHVLLREAMAQAKASLGSRACAALFFGEEQPYTGLASDSDWSLAKAFIRKTKLRPLDYAIDADRKVALLAECYPSQVEESYFEGVRRRAAELALLHRTTQGVERIYH